MSKAVWEIGPTPTAEECAALGTPHFAERSSRECAAFVKQIERQFAPLPPGVSVYVQHHRHEFGPYPEVSVGYDDENQGHVEFIRRLEAETPTHWDDQSRKELDFDPATA